MSIRSLPSKFPSAFWPIVATICVCIAALVPQITLFAGGAGFVLWGIILLRCLLTLLTRRYRLTRMMPSPPLLSINRRLSVSLAAGILVTSLMVYLPIWSVAFFWLHRSGLEKLAARVPYSMAIYDSFGDASVGKYPVQGIGRYPHWLEIDLIATPLPIDPKPTFTPHEIEFILEDEKNYHYDNSDRFRVSGTWYVPTYSVFRRAITDLMQWQEMNINKS